MGALLFYNIGWMNRYEGLKGKPNKIVGGGRYVDKSIWRLPQTGYLRAMRKMPEVPLTLRLVKTGSISFWQAVGVRRSSSQAWRNSHEA